MNLSHVRAIARKEVYHLLRDFRSLYLAFAVPLLLILLFGYALSLDVEKIETVVVDQDQTGTSRDFVGRLGASSYFRIVAFLPDSRAVTEALDYGRATMAVVIPPGWSSRLQAERVAPLQVLLDGSDPNFAGIARAYVTAFIESDNRQRLVAFLDRQGLEPVRPPVEGRIRVWFNEDLQSRNFIVPGIIAIIIMIVGAILTSLVIAREYENGTMETIPYQLIALGQMALVTAFAVFWFEVPLAGSLLALFGATCLFLLSTLGIGLFISTIAKTQQQAMMTTFFFILPFFMLSGFVFPIADMPEVVRWLTYLNPLRYFLVVIRSIFLKGVGLEVLWPQYVALALLGIAVFSGAVGRFRKSLD